MDYLFATETINKYRSANCRSEDWTNSSAVHPSLLVNMSVKQFAKSLPQDIFAAGRLGELQFAEVVLSFPEMERYIDFCFKWLLIVLD